MAQVPEEAIFPPFPDEGKMFQMPFYYSAASFFWVFYKVPADKMQRHLDGTELAVARFKEFGEDYGVVALNFQNYASLLGMMITTVNEVEMNLHAYPISKEAETPLISLADYLRGQEQSKWIGSFRLHVPADNPHAVQAGIEVFGERKFLTTFNYMVPAPNNYVPDTVTTWEYTVNEPPPKKTGTASCSDDPPPKPHPIYSLSADVSSQQSITGNASPLTLYSCLPGGPDLPPGGPEQRLIGSRWNLFGLYRDYYPLSDEVKAKVKLDVSDTSEHPMAVDMRELLDEGAEPIVVRVFHSNPAAVENRAYYIEPGAAG